MIESEMMTIIDPIGLHARPTSVLVKIAKNFDAQVQIVSNDKKASLSSMMKVLALSVIQGSEIKLIAEGNQAQEAIDALIAEMKQQNLI
jgi:phosphocarrier protein HPr